MTACQFIEQAKRRRYRFNCLVKGNILCQCVLDYVLTALRTAPLLPVYRFTVKRMFCWFYYEFPILHHATLVLDLRSDIKTNVNYYCHKFSSWLIDRVKYTHLALNELRESANCLEMNEQLAEGGIFVQVREDIHRLHNVHSVCQLQFLKLINSNIA